MIAAPRRARAWAVLCALLALAWACTDVALTGPLARRLASLVLPKGAFRTPYVLAGATARIDTVRIVLKRSDSTVVLDTSIFVPFPDLTDIAARDCEGRRQVLRRQLRRVHHPNLHVHFL